MQVHNRCRYPYATKVTSRRPPQAEMVVVVRARFHLIPDGVVTVVDTEDDPLAHGFLSAETYDDDDVEQAGACRRPNDFADFKLNAEALLRGTCHPPKAKPVRECQVSFAVGSWRKTLDVIGPRAWSDRRSGAAISDPIPFTEMPLDYEHAFGGTGYGPNPVGKGWGTNELPNVELPHERVRTTGHKPLPASFGPINPRWPQRRGLVGKNYGEDYGKTRAPWYADDFDWRYFHDAPGDQQLEGYLLGDEELRLVHLHPSHPKLVTRLPKVRVRSFTKDDRGAIVEVPMRLDTLFVDADAGTVDLTWRGLAPVREDDLHDVQTLLIDTEHLSDEPKPEKHYHDLIEEFEADPIGVQHALSTEKLDEGKATLERLDAVSEAVRTGELEGDPLTALLGAALGPDDPRVAKLGAALSTAHDRPDGAPAGPDLNAQSAGALEVSGEPSPLPRVFPGAGEPPKPPPGVASAELAHAIEETKKAQASLGDAEVDPRTAEAMAQLEANAGLLEPVEPIEPGANLDLSGQDYRNRNLRGADLQGSNLEGALLTGADLQGAQLAGAKLAGAVLYRADLSDADLSDTILTDANLAEIKGHGASFRGAHAERTLLDQADLTDADLSGLRGDYPQLRDAVLVGARLDGARLFQAFFHGVDLSRSRWHEATLLRCLLYECNLTEASFEGSVLSKTSFGSSNLTGASFNRARGEGVVFLHATLDGGDFGLAVMPSCHFFEASAKGTRFYGANLKSGSFYRAMLDEARFGRANLHGADMRKASLHRAVFTNTCLFDATLLGAKGKGADFSGANLKRARWEALP